MIHSTEMLIPVTYEDVQHLFSRYGINVAKYEYIGAAVEQLNYEVKKDHEAFAIAYISCKGKGEWNVHIKVDLVKLLKRGDISESDYNLVESKIKGFLIKLFGHSSYFADHRLTRIDYRYDVVVPNKKDRELLFHLFEKYTQKYCYKEKIKWGKDKDGNPFKYDTSQYHKCKSTEIFIYSKEDERIAKGEKVEPYESSVVRYELRLWNRHLSGMNRTDKGKGRPRKLKEYFKENIRNEYLKKQILPIVHHGDYYKLRYAEEIIDNSKFSRLKKEKLRAFLVSISKGSIDTPKKNGMSAPTYRHYLHDLESLGINPILIPKNRTDFPNFLKNPFQI